MFVKLVPAIQTHTTRLPTYHIAGCPDIQFSISATRLKAGNVIGMDDAYIHGTVMDAIHRRIIVGRKPLPADATVDVFLESHSTVGTTMYVRLSTMQQWKLHLYRQLFARDESFASVCVACGFPRGSITHYLNPSKSTRYELLATLWEYIGGTVRLTLGVPPKMGHSHE